MTDNQWIDHHQLTNMMMLLFLFFVFVILTWLQYYTNFVACTHASQSYLNPELKYQNTI